MKHRVFTLIELLIVVAIIGILITVGMTISYKTDKFQDLHKKFIKQKGYKERLYNQR
jgi:prepilin-type N-terminal cleavage/methylation domain-containing protein|tara:strand:- start:149 stop:319 length:171 start_codon:yes stop_codon:yes gene_type:complete